MRKILIKIKDNTFIIKEKIKLSSEYKNIINTNVISCNELVFSDEYILNNKNTRLGRRKVLNIIWPIFIIISIIYAIISGNLKILNLAITSSTESVVSLTLTLIGTTCLWRLRAMEELQKENHNKDFLSNNMMMLIILNTSSLQIIPTTIIAIRTSLGSNDPTKIIFPVWFSTICAGIVGIVSTKLIIRITEKGCE